MQWTFSKTFSFAHKQIHEAFVGDRSTTNAKDIYSTEEEGTAQATYTINQEEYLYQRPTKHFDIIQALSFIGKFNKMEYKASFHHNKKNTR